MTTVRRIYTAAVIGAFGGWIAAAAHQLLIVPRLGHADSWLTQFLLDIALGALIGAPIGFFERFFDGINRHSSDVALRIGALGALVGAVGGMAVLWFSEYLHHLVSGGYLGRALAVSLLGLLIGSAEALSGGSRRWRGLVGGAVGGVLAGLLLEFLLRTFHTPDSAIVSLMLLGSCILTAIAVFVEVMPDAVLEGLSGPKVVGQAYHLGRFRDGAEAVIGSGKSTYIWVADAMPEHAAITLTPRGGHIHALHPKAEILVNGAHQSDSELVDGDEIKVASARFLFRLRAGSQGGRKVKFLDPNQRTHARVSRIGVGALLAIIVAAQLATAENYRVDVQRVAILRDGRVTGSVLIVDPQGHPLTDRLPVRLSIYENAELRSARIITSGRVASTVLALDVSGSMRGPKMVAAQKSAIAYTEHAQPGDQIAIVAFSTTPSVASPFSSSPPQLAASIKRLVVNPRGRTAIADALTMSIDMLRSQAGRKSVVILTDGIDNGSKATPDSVRTMAEQADVTVTLIGLGGDVNSNYLQRFGGQYLFAPGPTDLEALFRKVAVNLASEYDFEFKSPLPLDGMRRNITARVEVGSNNSVETSKRPVAPRFLPAVRGNLLLYLSLALFLLVTAVPPRVVADVAGAGHVWRVHEGSSLVGRSDGNRHLIKVGDPVVQCPTCQHCHHVRSWRMNNCKCFNDKTQMLVCRHRILPAWTRRMLDNWSGHASDETGRRWLCKCRGDEGGF